MQAPAAVVPIKGFAAGKSRLAVALDGPERAALSRSMAEGVLAALAPLPVFVATDDEHVAAWALSLDAQVVWTVGRGLNGSVEAGVEAARAAGHGALVLAHADLPFARPFAGLTSFPGVTLVPDRAEDGTNVIVVPAGLDFPPAYGPASFTRHLAQARASGRPVRICRRDDLRWDVDVPADMARSGSLTTGAPA